MNFPIAINVLKALPRSSGIGRSNVKQVAEKRSGLLQDFLDSLSRLADEIAHSDLVYTFFHPLLKDEEYMVKDSLESSEGRNTMEDLINLMLYAN
jgi:phosphatidylinositol-4-phosphate 3-kinase